MGLHVFAFLLVVCLPLPLALLWCLDWLRLQPSHSRGGAKRTTRQRLLKPRCPHDCPACRLASTPSLGGGPAPLPVRPWSEVKSRRGAPKRIHTNGFACPVQPLSVVDNSSSFPNRLTDPLEALYSIYSEGKGPLPAHFQAKRMLHVLPSVSARVLAHLLSVAAVYPMLAPSWSCPVENSCQGAHVAPSSAQAAHPRRLSRLSTRSHSLVGPRTSPCSFTPLARGQKPARSTQASQHRGIRLPQPEVSLLRDYRGFHSCPCWRWQAWPY